jgi:hypothetical protein
MSFIICCTDFFYLAHVQSATDEYVYIPPPDPVLEQLLSLQLVKGETGTKTSKCENFESNN